MIRVGFVSLFAVFYFILARKWVDDLLIRISFLNLLYCFAGLSEWISFLFSSFIFFDVPVFFLGIFVCLSAAPCPRCGHDKAYFKTMQIRSADEPESRFYRCVKWYHTPLCLCIHRSLRPPPKKTKAKIYLYINVAL